MVIWKTDTKYISVILRYFSQYFNISEIRIISQLLGCQDRSKQGPLIDVIMSLKSLMI